MSSPIIPGFHPHGDRYRTMVSLPADLAREISEEARRRDVPVAVVLRERIATNKRNDK